MSYLCICGHVIKDNTYPSENRGDLKWQTERDKNDENTLEALKSFFEALDSGKKQEWLELFFNNAAGDELAGETVYVDGTREKIYERENVYLRADMTTIVYDIRSRFERDEGHSVFRCPKCERIYIQDKYGSDNYACFEKRSNYSR